MPEDTNENQTFVTLEQLEEIRENLKADLLTEMNKAVTGATSRSSKALQTTLSEQIQSQFAPILEALQPKEQTTEQTPQSQEQQNQNYPEGNELASSLQQFKSQLAALQQQNKQLAEQLQAQQRETETERLQRLQTEYKGRFYTQVADKVTDPDAFLTVLQSKTGATFDPDKGFVVRGKDEFGNETITPINEITDSFLQNDLAYFAKPRPGNGTGSAPSGQQSRQSQSLFSGEGTNREAIARLAQESLDPIAAITAELLKSNG